jgi:hypothetical protein
MSDGAGRFSVTGIPPGTYMLFTERTGFGHMMTLTGAIPLPSIMLRPGERITDYRLEMTPRAVIAGRVLDEYGDPVPNVKVEAAPINPVNPRAASLNAVNPVASTNSRGEFRISGGPGKFYIKATPGGSNQAQEIRTDSSSDAAYGPIWFPSATSPDRAAAVEVEAGADAAIEIRLIRQRSITITGTVTGIPPGSSATINLASGNSTRGIGVGPDGRFTLSKLPLGSYRIWAFAPGNLRSQRVEVMPDGPDIVEVQLVLTAGAEVTGTVEIAGDPPDRPREKRTITLGSSSATSEPDGSFKISAVFPDRYAVEVQPLPDNGYVKTVELDGVTTLEREVDFARVVEGSRLKITLGRDGAQLSGTVLEKDGQPLGTSVAIVILASDRDHIFPNQDGLVKEGGKYSLKGIRPGKYLLFAIDAFRSGPSSSLEDFQKLAVVAEEIELKAGDRITKDLKVLLKEDVDARSKK